VFFKGGNENSPALFLNILGGKGGEGFLNFVGGGGGQKSLRFSRTINEPVLKIMAGGLDT